LWAEIHSGVERLLGPLEEEVRREVAGVRIVAGRTQGTSFFFSYRTFSLPECAVDPVVVGMTFTPTVGGVRVDADASGESIGDVLLSVPSEIVAATGEEMLAAAARAVGLLGHAAGFIAAALANPTRRVS